MSQHDMNIANADGATVRADINAALAALVSQNSGATAPTTTFPYMWWADAANDILKMRNAADSAWISMFQISTGMPLFGGADLYLAAGKKIIFEGTTDDAYEVTIDPGDPTADREFMLPDKSGTLATTNDVIGKVNDFRLTLTSGAPVTTSNVAGATSIYCAPYKGNQIGLYTGSAWVIRSSSEFSLALGTLTSGKPYDVFCYDNSGTPTLEFLVWTSDTTRATALAYQDGILVKSGDATRRYLGTFYTTSTTTTEDSETKRYLWNYYHRVKRTMRRVETTASWTYTTNTFRQANGSSSNQVECVLGVSEDAVNVNVTSSCVNSSTVSVMVGIGVDSTTINSAVSNGGITINASHACAQSAVYDGIVSAGRHYFAWLEASEAGGTTTWYGNGTLVVTFRNGLSGSVFA